MIFFPHFYSFFLTMRYDKIFFICFIICVISLGIPSGYYYITFINLTDETKYIQKLCLVIGSELVYKVYNNYHFRYVIITEEKTDQIIAYSCTTSASRLGFAQLDKPLGIYGYQFENNYMIWACGHTDQSLNIGSSFNCSIRHMRDNIYMALIDLGDKTNSRPEWRVPYVDWVGLSILFVFAVVFSLGFLFLSFLLDDPSGIVLNTLQIHKRKYILLHCISDLICYIILYFIFEKCINDMDNPQKFFVWVISLDIFGFLCKICAMIRFKPRFSNIILKLICVIDMFLCSLYIIMIIISLYVLLAIPCILSLFWYFIALFFTIE
jgi:hypothetical protein